MDLPLKLKQQMWIKHQLEKEQMLSQLASSIAKENVNHLNTAMVQTSMTNLNDQSSLEIIGSSSRIHLEKSMSIIQPNNLSSASHINIEPNTWTVSGRLSNQQAVVTEEISKFELMSPYKDAKPQEISNDHINNHGNRIKLSGLIESTESSHEVSSDNVSSASKKIKPSQPQSFLESPANKKSKIIYSINKSTRNKNSPQRSRNFLYNNDSQFNIKKTLDSKRSKKSTASKKNPVLTLEPQIIDSAFLSSIAPPLPKVMKYQDELGSEIADVPVIKSHESSFHRSRPKFHRKTDSQNEDLIGVNIQNENHDFNLTQISIKVDSKRAQTINAIKSSRKSQSKHAIHSQDQRHSQQSITGLESKAQRNASASTIPKYQSLTRDKKNATKELKIQRLKIHDRNDSQRSIQESPVPHIRHEEGPSVDSSSQRQNISQSKYQTVRAKMIETRTSQMKMRSKSVKSLQESQQHTQKVLTLIASIQGNMIPLNEQFDDFAKAKEPSVKHSIVVKEEIKEPENFKRQDSALTQGSEAPSSSFEALHLQLIKRDPPTKRIEEEKKSQEQNQITMEIQQEAQDQFPARKSFKHVLSKHHSKAQNEGEASPSFMRMQTEFKFSSPSKNPLLASEECEEPSITQVRPSTSQNNLHQCSKISIVVGQVELVSPQIIQQQIDDAVFGNQINSGRLVPQEFTIEAKRSTLTVNEDYADSPTKANADFKKALDTIPDIQETHKLSISQYNKDSSIMDEGDRYQMQAAMLMEKVVVKSPGRETTDHVKTGGGPQPFSITSLISEIPMSIHQKQLSIAAVGKPSHKGRRMSEDLKDVVGSSDRMSQSPKRTILIKKSKGQNDLAEIVMDTHESQQNNSKPEVTAGKTKYAAFIHKGQVLPSSQILPLDDLQSQDFIYIQNQSEGNVIPINDPRRDMPRHGTAAPSVIRRNKETIRRKKGSQPTQQRQASSQEPRKDILSATFHVFPITVQRPATQASHAQRKSKTPSNPAVYQHTNKMQTLVIQQSELAIDSNQQKMQLKLIQAFNDHQVRMLQLNPDLPRAVPDQSVGILRMVPVIIQPGTIPQPLPRVFDSLDDVSSLAALHQIIEEGKSKNSSQDNTAAGLPIADSASLSKLNGWKESNPIGYTVSEQNSFSENPILRDSLASRAQQAPPVKNRSTSRNRVNNSKGPMKPLNKPQNDEKLAVVGKNLKN